MVKFCTMLRISPTGNHWETHCISWCQICVKGIRDKEWYFGLCPTPMSNRMRTFSRRDSNFICTPKFFLWVHSISFPGSTPVCPQYVLIALTSFEGLTRISPKCSACGTGHWGRPEVHDVTTRGWVIVRLALVRGSPKWAPRGRHGEANQKTLCIMTNHPWTYFVWNY